MFHIGRSGSTILGDLFQQHPKVFWDGEVYERIIKETEETEHFGVNCHPSGDPIKLLASRMTQAGKKIYVFETKFFHLNFIQCSLPQYIQQLEDCGFTHFIILERKNYLRKIVSSLIAHRTSRWHQRPDERPVRSPIELDLDNVQIDRDAKPLIAYLQDYHENFRRLEELLSGRRVLQLRYEDDLSEDPCAGFERVCTFLGIGHREVSVRYSKTNPFKLSEIILNLEEVECRLRGTPFEWMVYE